MWSGRFTLLLCSLLAQSGAKATNGPEWQEAQGIELLGTKTYYKIVSENNLQDTIVINVEDSLYETPHWIAQGYNFLWKKYMRKMGPHYTLTHRHVYALLGNMVQLLEPDYHGGFLPLNVWRASYIWMTEECEQRQKHPFLVLAQAFSEKFPACRQIVLRTSALENSIVLEKSVECLALQQVFEAYKIDLKPNYHYQNRISPGKVELP